MRFPLVEYRHMGLNYGMRQQALGVTAHRYLTTSFGVLLLLDTYVTWRPPRQGNTYFRIDLTRHHVVNMEGYISLAPAFTYRRVVSDSKATDQMFLGLGLWRYYGGVTLAYAQQNSPASENDASEDQGMTLMVHTAFSYDLHLKLSATYWFDDFQYAMAVTQNLFRSRFFVSVGYEKISSWSEYDVSLMYNL
jgi:hypothetical protein